MSSTRRILYFRNVDNGCVGREERSIVMDVDRLRD